MRHSELSPEQRAAELEASYARSYDAALMLARQAVQEAAAEIYRAAGLTDNTFVKQQLKDIRGDLTRAAKFLDSMRQEGR